MSTTHWIDQPVDKTASEELVETEISKEATAIDDADIPANDDSEIDDALDEQDLKSPAAKK